MKVAGYVVAATALALTKLWTRRRESRREHIGYYGEDSCSPDVFPYVAPLGFVAGMAVGLTGSYRDYKLTREHGSVGAQVGGWRSALAALGVATAMGMLTGSLVSICSS